MLPNATNGNCSMLLSYPDVLTFNQLCQILQIGKKTGYALLHNNEIKYRRIGKKYIIAKNSVIEFLEKT